jgi:hypothetical protein
MSQHTHTWQLQEDGYSRTWHTTIDQDTKTVTAHYGGSEDWSDEGDGNMRLVCHCGETTEVPADWEIDYQ